MAPGGRDVREVIREGPLWRQKILQVLQDGPHTVKEVAQAIGAPAHETIYWVMDLRKYGWIAELPDPDDEGLFSYQAIERKGS